MREWQGRRYWIIGASDDFGRAVAEKLSRVGVSLVLSGRNEEPLTQLADALPGRAEAMPCDITDDDSVARAVENVGDMDGVIFMEEVQWPVSATDWKPDQVMKMAELNFLGACRVMGHVVPGMVARDRGHIVLTGSLSGHRGTPHSIGYAASKAGIMVLAEGMYADLRDTSVEVQLVNPGTIRAGGIDGQKPEAAAQQVFEHMSSDNFVRNFPGGQAIATRGMNLLPGALYYRLVT